MALFDEQKLSAIKQQLDNKVKHPILIVDDEEYNLQTLSSLLQEDYQPIAARAGEQALEILKNHPLEQPIRLIISDQRMPKMTGVEFLTQSLTLAPHAKRIILTGYTDIDAIIRAINDCELYKFILKPFDPNDLLLTVRRALEAYQLEIQNTVLINTLKRLNTSLEEKVKERTQELEKQRKALHEMHKKERRAREELAQLAWHDSLTGLANRRLFQDRIEHSLAICRRTGSQGALMYLDIDNFKQINDRLGHQCGDDLLVEVAQRLTQCLRASDLLSRFGGDEFIIIQENIASAYDAATLAEKILLAFNQPFNLCGQTVQTSTSIGITLFNEHSQQVSNLITQADNAMYEAKRSGRGVYKFHEAH